MAENTDSQLTALRLAEEQACAGYVTARKGHASTGEVELALSLWDALLVGRVSATRPGLRARTWNAAPHPTAPTAHPQEVAS